MPNPRPAFPNHTPSRRVTARKFPAEYSWWRVSGWQMVVEDKADGGLHVFSSRRHGGSTRLWGTQASAEETATPEEVRHFLTVSLYLHLHPRKATKHYTATGQVCTDKELATFIRGQQRKVAKAG